MPLRKESGLTSLQIPGGRTVLIDNRVGSAPADTTLLSFARGGTEEGYTVISDFADGAPQGSHSIPCLHICTLLRPGKHVELAGVIRMMGTLSACHAIERNSDTHTLIRWLGDIYPEHNRFSFTPVRRIAAVDSESLLLPSGYLDYMLLHVMVEMPESRFPVRMVDAVTRIFTSRPITNADHVTQDFLHDFFGMYDPLMHGGTDGLAFMDEYKRRSLLLGRRVRFRANEKKMRGRAITVQPSGLLTVRTQSGKEYHLSSPTFLL